MFLLCALLPVALTIGLSYAKVESTLVEERMLQLGQAAAGFGASVSERLSLAEHLTAAIATRRNAGETADPELRRYFDLVAVVTPATRPQVLLGAPQALPPQIDEAREATHLKAGGAVLVVTLRETGAQRVWLVRALDAHDPGRGLLAAAINEDFLWGSAKELPYATSVCVLAPRGVPMYCSEPLPESGLGAMREQLSSSAGRQEWTQDGVRYLSSFRELLLRPQFDADGWPVVMSQPAALALGPAHAVRRVVVPVVLLGLLFAGLLGLVQVRRMLSPLHSLADATRRIAARDFSVRVAVTGNDEFGDLAVSFNGMSDRLGRQFRALNALARIDAVILSKVDVDQIAVIVLERVKEVVAAEHVMLLLSTRLASRHFVAHAVEGAGSEWHRRALDLGEEDIRRLLAAPHGLHMDRIGAAAPLPASLADIPGETAFALPILLDGCLGGMIVLGHAADQAPDDDAAGLLQDLADRVAVALATANRDLELHRRAHYDPLTQLPNRLMFLEELTREIARAERQQTELALLFIDLDGFSSVNDSLGHAAGDELLLEAASRLKTSVRKGDLVARLGGDEFIVILPELRETNDAAIVARHIIETLTAPYDIGHADTFISASVGIALYPADGADAQELLRHADLAMYRAKEARGTHAFFEEDMNREVQRRFALARELRQALECGEFELRYQAQLELRTDRIVGAEALIRWRHPQHGMIAPASFIGFAEESGLIEAIGEWALRGACTQFVKWRAAGHPLEHISVNVSPRQLRHRDFIEQVRAALASTGMDPARLRLEITEGVLVDESGATEATLARLVELGISLELDDFGTGYSSLSYLQRLPVDTIKLDRSFIAELCTNQNARAIARAAIAMVHALEKEVVAEGVENEEQLTLLRRWGCDAIQGYLLGKPIAPAAFMAFVDNAAREREVRAA